MGLFILTRHGESVLNTERRVNGDPTRCVGLSERGAEESRALGAQVAEVPLDVCVHTQFSRTKRTAELALAGRDVPLLEQPLFNDIDVGDLEGLLIDEYRAWKKDHQRSDPFPGGESLDDAARRYANALRTLLVADYTNVLVVCHEIPVRYALNSASGSDQLDAPIHDIKNATPYLFDEEALERAAARMEELAETPATTARTG